MNPIRRFAWRLRNWILAPILQELEQCRSALHEFNAEIRPAATALLNLLQQGTRPRNITTVNADLYLMEQLCAAASAIGASSRSSFQTSSETPAQYRELQERLAGARALARRWRDCRDEVGAALARPEAGRGGTWRRYSALISTMTFGYLGHGLERDINSIHDEMNEMTRLVRFLLTHNVSVDGVDFVVVEAKMRDTIRMAEEALLSLLVDACAQSDLAGRKATGLVLDANQHPDESENTLVEISRAK